MSGERFWSLVESVEWQRVAHSVPWKREQAQTARGERARLMARMRPEEASAFQMALMERLHELDRVVQDFVAKGGHAFPFGEEAWRNLRAHIVGLGRGWYRQILSEPQRISTYEDMNLESFLEVTPSPAAWDYPEALRANARRLSNEYRRAAKAELAPLASINLGYIADILQAFAVKLAHADVSESDDLEALCEMVYTNLAVLSMANQEATRDLVSSVGRKYFAPAGDNSAADSPSLLDLAESLRQFYDDAQFWFRAYPQILEEEQRWREEPPIGTLTPAASARVRSRIQGL